MNPLALDIWLFVAVAYVFVSITIWIVARFSPFEWHSAQSGCSTRTSIGHHNYDMGDGFEYTSVHNTDDIDGDGCHHHHDDDNEDHYHHNNHYHDHNHHHNHYHNSNLNGPDENFDDNADVDYENENINNIFDEPNDLNYLTSTELLCMENDFTLRNSFWFTIGTLMQQGSDLNPKASNI